MLVYTFAYCETFVNRNFIQQFQMIEGKEKENTHLRLVGFENYRQ